MALSRTMEPPELPFEGNAKSDVFKVYMRDTGLLMSMLDDGSRENIIADTFSKQGKKLYYYEHNNKLEIDFFIRKNNAATAIEVKSADNTKSKSMDAVMAMFL